MTTLFDVRRDERGPLLTAACGFFFVLSALMLLRPVRDAAGMAGGMESVRLLFMVTALVTLALNPVFGLLVGRVRRARAITTTYGFFGATLIAFWALLVAGSGMEGRSGQAFYVWFSVLNVFGTMVFWALVVDRFTREQGTRLFALVAMGGTLGAVFGSWLTSRLAQPLGALHLLPVSAAFLALAMLAAWRLDRVMPAQGAANGPAEAWPPDDAAPISGGAWDGMRAVMRSRYLAGIAGYVLLMAVMATLVYLTRLRMAGTVAAGADAMAAMLASIDMWTQIVFLVLQCAMATRLGRRLRTGTALAALPLATVFGFAGLAWQGSIAVLFALEAINRTMQRGVARPARELLFTRVARDGKYKAKAFIDTFVYRMGDVVGAQLDAFGGRALPGWGGMAAVAIPLGLAWALLALWLGRRYEQGRHGAAKR